MTTKPRAHITLIHYFTTRNAPPAKYIVYQTLIYGELIPLRSHRGTADFRIAIKRGSTRAEVDLGKDVLEATGLKAKILRESRKRIAVVRKKLAAGKPVSRDWGEFTV